MIFPSATYGNDLSWLPGEEPSKNNGIEIVSCPIVKMVKNISNTTLNDDNFPQRIMSNP